MHKAFPLPVMEFRLPEEVPTASRKEMPLLLRFVLLQKSRSSASDGTGKKKGRTVTLTTDDMKKRKNDRNRSDLDTRSLDDLYNHLKVYESEMQKKSEPNSQNMAFISSEKHSKGNEEVNTASVSTASTNVSTASANIEVTSISQDTACAYIFSQSSGSQIKFKDINQIDKDDMEEMDIKWNMALLSMRADRFWKKTWKRISIQGTDVAGFDKSKDWSYTVNDDENYALVANEEAPLEFDLMAKTSADSEVFDNSLCSKAYTKNSNSLNRLAQVEARLAKHRSQELKYYEKIRVLEFNTESRANSIKSITKDLELLEKEKGKLETKLTGFQTASKDLDSLLESQRLDKNKEGLGYSVVPPPTQIYSPLKKDMSWTGLPEFKDDTITDYSRPSPTIESTSDDAQNRNPSVTETEASPSTISPKPFIKFVKANDSPTKMRSQFKDPKVATVNRKFPTVNRKLPTVNRKFPTGNTKFSTADIGNKGKATQVSDGLGPQRKRILFVYVQGSSQNNIDEKGYWDSGCSRHITGNISYLSDYEPFDGGYVSFGQGGCKITGKETIKTGKLEFENVYFVKDLKYNLFSVSQICDNKNSVMFTDSECIVLGRDFKLLDDANVLLRTPRQHNMYSIDLNNIVSHKYLTCLVAKASTDEEAAKTMLVDAKLPVTFWAEAVNTACYVQNRVLVNKSYNKTPYELFNGRSLAIGFLKPFGCHVVILNTLDHLGKFEAKGDEGYFIGYFMSSKAFRVFNKRTKRVEKNLHVEFLENNSIEKGAGPNWLFDIDSLTKSMNYVPVVTGTNSTNLLGTKDTASQEVKKDDERGIVIRNKARLVAHGHTQEEGIDYDEVFAPVARIETIRLFLAYASFMGFTVYQMDVKSAFLYGTIDEEVHQVTPKECHLHEVKRIFRYLKGHPKMGLWYPKESPFDLVAYSDSDYDGATQDRKSTTGGCQFLGRRLISWQCKKQTIVATSIIETEYVAAASCYGQVL
nr:hypothetical protein [Tanacetum cinerariifolium]